MSISIGNICRIKIQSKFEMEYLEYLRKTQNENEILKI